MDIKRPPKSKIKKRLRSSVLIFVGVAAIGGISYGLTKLKPAAPTLDRSTVVIETVKRGEMLREVRGVGTLVPQITRWVPAPADGRVEKINVQAGVPVTPDTVIVDLSNPQMEQQATDAEFQVKAAEADEVADLRDGEVRRLVGHRSAGAIGQLDRDGVGRLGGTGRRVTAHPGAGQISAAVAGHRQSVGDGELVTDPGLQAGEHR